MPDLTVVLPTINEAGNIGPLIRQLREALPDAAFLVIDGDSKDDTRAQAAAEGATVVVNANGYADSLLQGLREAGTEWVLVLDADGSHTAHDARKLWDAREGTDMVVGSRFAPGGGSDGSTFRRFLSRTLAGMFAAMARLPARDVSSGFRLYRRAMFADASITARFFEVQPALLAWGKRQGARVKEVGIHYHPRGKGKSKNRVLRYGIAFLRQLWRLRKV
ncbi:MAG: glycosyltransferase [Planctomycetes bacterium]|nr:glycosyltransferase [Planctomycetota bacterium]MCW8136881.1 glycosyltransferase [Planctomycetota bacterium]